MMQLENVNLNLTESMTSNDIEQNNDRELIFEFLEHTKIVQKALTDMDTNNKEMVELV